VKVRAKGVAAASGALVSPLRLCVFGFGASMHLYLDLFRFDALRKRFFGVAPNAPLESRIGRFRGSQSCRSGAELTAIWHWWQASAMRLLGLDVGSRTIGLAVCDEAQAVATPLRTLTRRGGTADLEAVRSAMNETGAGALVLGLPLSLSGEEGEAARRVRTLGQALAEHLGCPVHYWDERFSTAEAERVLLQADVSRGKRKQVVNHLAATLILQGYLDHQAREAGA
jgi:putative Holliday junction resolvase